MVSTLAIIMMAICAEGRREPWHRPVRIPKWWGLIWKERKLGRVVSPLDPCKFACVQTSPIGLIPKGSSGKWRMIVDLLSPEGSSVNEGIDGILCSLEYISVDTIARVLAEAGRGTLLAKMDIKSV